MTGAPYQPKVRALGSRSAYAGPFCLSGVHEYCSPASPEGTMLATVTRSCFLRFHIRHDGPQPRPSKTLVSHQITPADSSHAGVGGAPSSGVVSFADGYPSSSLSGRLFFYLTPIDETGKHIQVRSQGQPGQKMAWQVLALSCHWRWGCYGGQPLGKDTDEEYFGCPITAMLAPRGASENREHTASLFSPLP